MLGAKARTAVPKRNFVKKENWIFLACSAKWLCMDRGSISALGTKRHLLLTEAGRKTPTKRRSRLSRGYQCVSAPTAIEMEAGHVTCLESNKEVGKKPSCVKAASRSSSKMRERSVAFPAAQ